MVPVPVTPNIQPDVFLPSPTQPLRVVVAGYGAIALRVVQALLAHPTDCSVVGIFRWNNRKSNHWRERLTRWPPDALNWQDQDAYQLHRLMRCNGLRDITHCTGLNDPAFSTLLAETGADGVLIASWGEIIRPDTLAGSSTRCQWINIHPSLLPLHRGPNPYVACIQAGDLISGVTFHQVTTGIDAGPIWYQQTVPVFAHDTGGSLRERCALAAAESIPLVLRQLANPALLPPVPQDDSKASYFRTVDVEQVTLDFSQPPDTIIQHIRARQPWTDCHTFWQGRVPLSVGSAHCVPVPPNLSNPYPSAKQPGTVVKTENGQLTVLTTDPEQWLVLSKLRVYGQWGFWPLWLSRWWLARQVRTGQVLTSLWKNAILRDKV